MTIHSPAPSCRHTAYNIEIHAGTDDVYATVFDADGNKIPGICISVDNEHYLSGEHLTGLKPSTDYTLYYKQGINGTSCKAAFRTGSQGYGVTVGKTQVTAENTGNLETYGWHYDPETKTLTLKNLTLKSDGTVAKEWQLVGSTIATYAAIVSDDALTVELIGNNILAYTGKELGSAGIFAAKNVTVTGTGNLTFVNPVNNDAYGLYSDTGNIILSGSGALTFDRIRNHLIHLIPRAGISAIPALQFADDKVSPRKLLKENQRQINCRDQSIYFDIAVF